MITKLTASDWELGNASDASDLLYTIPPGAIVTVSYRSPDPGILYAVTPNGESVYLAQGSDINYRGRLDGFAGVSVRAKGAYAIRATCSSSSEAVDPTVMVHQPVAVLNPEKVAMRAVLEEYLSRAKLAGLFDTPEKQAAQFEELADDIANGDLEFDDPDPFSLTAAWQQEEERVRQRHLELMEEERDRLDQLEREKASPPGEPNAASPEAAPAPAAAAAPAA